MKILSLFGRPSLKPAWTFTPEGTIWRLYPARSGELVGEARDQDAKRVSFFAVDGATGTPFWQNLVFEEPWWIGIEDVTEGILLLHKFASPDTPQHRGIIAVDIRTGKRLWSNDEMTYWFAHKKSLYAHKMMFEKRVASELDIKSGQTMNEFSEDLEPSLFRAREEALRTNQDGLQFPEIVELDQADQRTSGIMKKELPADGIQGSPEFARVDSFLLMNYHVFARETSPEKPLLDNLLKIVDVESGKLVYSDIIVHNSPATVPDSFFIRNDTAYYIKDQKTLTAIHLSE